MGKDPAFLFYSSDFLTGTMFMNNEQVGIYIRLLCAQHQHGGMIDKVSFNALVGDHTVIRVKFVETDEGFFNERLMEEMAKRKQKSCNLSKNAQIRWSRHCKSNAIALRGHMPTENENENENESKDVRKKRIVKEKKPTLEEIKAHCAEKNSPVDPEAFFAFYESKGWKIGNHPMKSWKHAIITWEKRIKDKTTSIISPITLESGRRLEERWANERSNIQSGNE